MLFPCDTHLDFSLLGSELALFSLCPSLETLTIFFQYVSWLGFYGMLFWWHILWLLFFNRWVGLILLCTLLGIQTFTWCFFTRWVGVTLFCTFQIMFLLIHSDYALGQDSLLVIGGLTLRYSYCFQSERWAAIQTVRCESDSYSGNEIEGHTTEEILILFGWPGHSLKTQTSNAKGPANPRGAHLSFTRASRKVRSCGG